ncbi:DUF3592 domain-containing protein [Nocardioides pantholopis]|uniref:DUF3592 domain-containing protein n=1 Tax=Nocardioides pantholopis TaxID=2483798 RepID=UPI000FD9A08F|nr:hypothetical protein [Nocardioides pantholopis]
MSESGSRAPAARGGRSRLLLLAVVLVVVNLPLAQSLWERWQLDRSGVEVVADVRAERARDSGGEPTYLVYFTYPEEIDPAPQRTWPVEVDEDTHAAAVAGGTLRVRVLPEHQSVYAVDGQVRSSSVLVVTLLIDAGVLLGALLLWRFRGRMRPVLVLAADADVEPAPAEALLERRAGDCYLVRGRVVETAPGEVLLEVADRRVRVLLGVHTSLVGEQELAQARGRLVG